MKIPIDIEKIFSHAVALQQNGNLKNTIYGFKNFIYILNQDHTVLLKFVTKHTWENPIGFKANDYDNNNFSVEQDRIIFIKKDGDYIREKSCKTSDISPKKIHKMFKRSTKEVELKNPVIISKDILNLLDDQLSHLEFQCEKGEFSVKQRDIYSGSLITVKPNKEKSVGVFDKKISDFKTVGMRTSDFIALFTFVGSIAFYFEQEGIIHLESKDAKFKFKGLVSKCIYDELGG